MTNQNKTILVVDDDEKVRLLLRRCLEGDGYAVVEAENQMEVDRHLQAQHIDLITLDLQLGSESGLDIAANVRGQSNVPIIMVTGKGDVIDRVVGLEMGADDYIAKPFHVREVLARVRSVIRRSSGRTDEHGEPETEPEKGGEHFVYKFNGWCADPSLFELTDPSGDRCELTSTDFKLLHLFLTAPKRVLSRDHIMDFLSGNEWTPYDRTVDNQVARLRKKIEKDPGRPEIIKTVRGVGYTFATNVEKSPA